MEYLKHYEVLKETCKLYEEYKEKDERYDFLCSLGDSAPQKRQEQEEISLGFAHNINNSFQIEFTKFSETDYFFGCSFNVYKNTYTERLATFKKEFIDTDEIDFIKSELGEGIYEHKFKYLESAYFEFFEMETDKKIEKQIYYSLKKRTEFLQQRADGVGFRLGYYEPDSYLRTRYDMELSYILEPINKSIESKTIVIKGDNPKWFPIGLNYANGEIQKQIKNRVSARDIAKKYKLDTYHNYISATGIDKPNTDAKNIYSLNKLKSIYIYCIENNISVCDDFLQAYNSRLKEIS